MPGPPPPPPAAPPPMCPPPPPAFSPSPSKSGADNRGALLQSIRQGAKLKKTVTNDRSAPLVVVKTPSSNNNNNTSPGGGSPNTASSTVPNGLGLGGLFAGGMPKLRPTGKQLGVTKSNDNSSSSGYSSSNTSSCRPPGGLSLPQNPPQRNYNNIQSEVQSALKKQMASDSNRNRGPPPPAPVRNISQSTENLQNSGKQPYHSRNGSSNGLHVNTSTLHKSFGTSPQQTPTSPLPTLSPLQANTSTLHRKANSSANLTVFDSVETPSNNSLPARPSNRKPHLAPKPPVLNGKPAAPAKKLLMNGKPSGISRAQSMRTPRSPSPQSPDDANYHAKFGTVRNISSILDKSLGQNLGQRTRPALNGRPTAPPPSIPPQQTPPPPPSKIVVKPPNHAPPPPPNVIPQPPSHAPPPPPHRTNLQPQVPTRAPPAVPSNLNAPPPPPRHSSMRDVAGRRTSPLDLEARFRTEFHTVNQFPLPGLYRGLPKFYSSKTVGNKQQAPLPPNHIQLNNRLWDSSTC